MKIIKILSLLLFYASVVYSQKQEIQIFSDFPGGNIIVRDIRNDTVWLKPDLRDTMRDWFYWYFKIEGIKGRTVYFQFPEQKNSFTDFGPAYSLNNDEDWKWYGENSYANNGFKFSFSTKDTCAYFSMAFPYTQKNLDTFLNNMRNRELIKIDTLCITRKKRAVEEIRIFPSKDTRYKVLITSRHHACEMTANYVVEGIIQSIANETDLQFMRDYVEFLIIPFVDKDGVEDGDQGKLRSPRDHNRDYDDHPLYISTKAIMDEVPGWSEGILRITLDIHCPGIRGATSTNIYQVGSEDKIKEQQQIIFSELIEKNCNGELKYFHKNFLPFGTTWNNPKTFLDGVSPRHYMSEIKGVELATTIEFPYGNVEGIQVSKDNARIFGRAISYSFMNYLKYIEE